MREQVGIRRWGAIIIGFVGTTVVLRPGIEAIGLGAILTILAALGWAFVLLIIKSLGRTESSVTITTYMSLLMAPIALVPAPPARINPFMLPPSRPSFSSAAVR